MARSMLGSWLDGPKATLEQQGIDFGYPGQRLGLPESGPGRVATFNRRLVALVIDWFSALAISNALANTDVLDDRQVSLATLGIFAAQVALFTMLMGASFGQRVLGIGVRQITGQPVNVVVALIRTLLLCLVIPAVIWDRDGRGLHDKIGKSVVVHTR